ncbi:MAG: hypothetical protein QOK29_668 [Rhodospirillaceae bacterium]|nr:hypothetical protein [Rhodospirillaceae bacterium]
MTVPLPRPARCSVHKRARRPDAEEMVASVPAQHVRLSDLPSAGTACIAMPQSSALHYCASSLRPEERPQRPEVLRWPLPPMPAWPAGLLPSGGTEPAEKAVDEQARPGNFGWGTWIRTRVDGVRVRSPTARRSPSRGPAFAGCRATGRGPARTAGNLVCKTGGFKPGAAATGRRCGSGAGARPTAPWTGGESPIRSPVKRARDGRSSKPPAALGDYIERQRR